MKTYFTQPLKVLNITEDPKKGVLTLMLMSSSPGILDGDNYNIHLEAGEGCAVELQTQSYQRLFTMKNGATQNMRVQLKQGACFKYIPHPVVPHQSSDFVAGNRIFLSNGCTLIWGEVFTCGRKLNGEVFSFTRYQSITEIFMNNRLIIKENLFMRPGQIDASGMGQLEGFTHQATLLYLNESADVKELITILNAQFGSKTGIIYGITSAPINGIIIRLLGNKAEQLFDCLKQISSTYFHFKFQPDLT